MNSDLETLCLIYIKLNHLFVNWYSYLFPQFNQSTGISRVCNEHGTIYVISSDFGDRMTTQSMGLIVLLREHF